MLTTDITYSESNITRVQGELKKLRVEQRSVYINTRAAQIPTCFEVIIL